MDRIPQGGARPPAQACVCHACASCRAWQAQYGRKRAARQDGAVEEAGLHKRAVLRVHGGVVEADAAAQRVLQRPAGGALRGRLQALLLRAVAHEAARRAAAQTLQRSNT